MLAYGYRYGEVPLAKLTPIKESAEVLKYETGRLVDPTVRPPVAVSLGCHVAGAAAPHPDPEDADTMVAGVCKRFAIKPPTPRKELVALIKVYTRRWCEKNLKPLESHTDLTVPTWLLGTQYPEWRKQELMQTWEECGNLWDVTEIDCRVFFCKSFQKDETYPEYKHGRAINARSDEFKVMVGPIFKAIEAEVYKHPSFIKHVPVADRAAYISEMLSSPGSKFYATDYTAFEALFIAELMEAVEFTLYDYMAQDLPIANQFRELCRAVLAGENRCNFKHFYVLLEATRMSGEMCTSLGNGFSNLMFMLFMAERKGCSDVKGVVEGDDGLFSMKGDAPTKDDFAQLGLIIKMETHLQLSTASFCGIIFDEEDLLNVTNPMTVLVNFGWGSRRYAESNSKILRTLLKSKALSLAHSYPGCPILGSLAKMGLRLTEDISTGDIYHLVVNKRKTMNDWQRTWLMTLMNGPEAVFKDPPLATRLLVERRYGILVQHQIAIEKYLDGMVILGPIDFGLIDLYLDDCWKHYASNYVQEASGDIRRPSLPIQRMAGFKDELEFLCGWKPSFQH